MFTSLGRSFVTKMLAVLRDTWFVSALCLCALLGVPIIAILWSFTDISLPLWTHLIDTNLSLYIGNSLLLALGVGIGSGVLGVSLAWCVTQYEFWGRSWFQWALLLPLAMPAYIMAYTYTGLFDDLGWFDSRSLIGAIAFMSLVLYPYVFMLAKTAFSGQQQQYQEVAATLGITRSAYFLKIALPIARPAVLTGVALAMMEALADYGTVAFFGISTFTTGIFRTWFGMGEMQLASQLAGGLALFVLVVLGLEKHSRRNMRFYQTQDLPVNKDTSARARSTTSLSVQSSISHYALSAYCLSVLLLAFIVPVTQLCVWALSTLEHIDVTEYWTLLVNSFALALFSSILIVLIALCLSYAQRFAKTKSVGYLTQFAALGYAIPGTVLAIGILQPFGWLDEQLNYVWYQWFGEYIGLVFSGTFVALFFAYCVRFLSVAMHNTQTGLERIKPNIDDAVLTLGRGRLSLMRRIHFPLLRKSLLAASILVFVDVLKELPATLILRPFNFNTLAVKAFEYAADERLIAAAMPSVTIVIIGIIPVIMLTRAMQQN
jgi:iron(III) transport system permease protein